MAKSNSFFGKRRGSTKNFTFTVFNGHQVTKEKAEQVKNPRSLAQMRNRMVLTTSSAAYAAMKEIVDHSFEGYTYGLQNMSRFQSLNNKLLRANIGAATSQFAYCNYGEAQLLPGAYQVSEGKLNSLAAGLFTAAQDYDDGDAIKVNANIALGDAGLTADNVLSAIGIAVGDMVTTMVVWREGAAGPYHFDFIRLKSVKGGTTVLTADNIAKYFTLESSRPCAFLTPAKTALSFLIETPGGVGMAPIGSAFILSSMQNGAWARSTEKLSWPADFTFEPSADTAIATYPVGGYYILNGGDAVNGYEEGSLDTSTIEP